MTDCDGSCGGANTADMATIALQLGLLSGSTPTVTAALTRLYRDLVRHCPVPLCVPLPSRLRHCPLRCISTAFAAKTLPLSSWQKHCLCLVLPLSSRLRLCLCLVFPLPLRLRHCPLPCGL